MSLTFAQPTEWWLEIPPNIQTQCWQDRETLVTPGRREEFYLNQLCLRVFLPWFQQEYARETSIWPNVDSLPNIWEMVGGSCLTMGAKRLVLLPSETLDTGGLDIPQEWVDIPDWAADYYLAVQIDLENHWLRVWGYTTHQHIKKVADYDGCDRTYCLSSQDLKRDLNAFWNICQFCPDADTRAVIPPLQPLSPAQVIQAMQQLSQPNTVFPRLMLPFTHWASLIQGEDWRQQLYQRRMENQQAKLVKATTNLSQWLHNLFGEDWQPLDSFWGLQHPAFAYNMRRAREPKGFCAPRIKFVTLNAEVEPQTVALLMVLNSESDGRMGVRVQVHPAVENNHVPTDLILSIYSKDDEILQSVQARTQEDYMQLPYFRCQPGTQFRLQIDLSDDTFSETFSA
ncbi:DUF1822 family protein [Leptothoe sp. ISB3NOV94-8A]